MRITAALAFVLVTGFAAPAFSQSLVGTWTAAAETAGSKVSETLRCVKTNDGYAITAKLIGVPEGTAEGGPGTDIVLNGDSFSYKRTVSTPRAISSLRTPAWCPGTRSPPRRSWASSRCLTTACG